MRCENGAVALTPLRPDDPEQVAGYRLLGRLGAGGMGVVYLGECAGAGHVSRSPSRSCAASWLTTRASGLAFAAR